MKNNFAAEAAEAKFERIERDSDTAWQAKGEAWEAYDNLMVVRKTLMRTAEAAEAKLRAWEEAATPIAEAYWTGLEYPGTIISTEDLRRLADLMLEGKP